MQCAAADRPISGPGALDDNDPALCYHWRKGSRLSLDIIKYKIHTQSPWNQHRYRQGHKHSSRRRENKDNIVDALLRKWLPLRTFWRQRKEESHNDS